jgi:hypothetical protein
MKGGTNGPLLKATELWVETGLRPKMSTDSKHDTIEYLGGA